MSGLLLRTQRQQRGDKSEREIIKQQNRSNYKQHTHTHTHTHALYFTAALKQSLRLTLSLVDASSLLAITGSANKAVNNPSDTKIKTASKIHPNNNQNRLTATAHNKE